MPTAERNNTQMPVTKERKKEKKKRKRKKKERTDHKCLWQRKKDQTTNVDGKRKMVAQIKQANS